MFMSQAVTKQDLDEAMTTLRVETAEDRRAFREEIRQTISEAFDNFGIAIFKYLDIRFRDMETKFEDLRGNFRDLQSSVDVYAKQVETYQHESIARDSQVGRLERRVDHIEEVLDLD